MKPTMPWLTPKVVGELQKNKFLFVSLNSIYTDEDKRTIWLDLESNNFNLNTAKGSFIYAVIRKDVGTARDFSFLPLSFSQNSLVSSKSINLLNDEDLVEKISSLGLGRIKAKYVWPTITDDLIKVYEEVIS